MLKKHDRVIVNPEFCYVNYSNFALRHPQYMLRWSYRSHPDGTREYEIVGIHGDIVVIRGTDCKVNKRHNPIYFIQKEGVELIDDGKEME